MTISSSGLIQATDFNSIRTVVSNVLALYGQSMTSEAVDSTKIITAEPSTSQWIYLYADMKKVADHQGTNINALKTTFESNIGPGKLVNYLDIKLFYDTANLLYTNRFNGADASFSFETISTSSRSTYWGKGNKTTVQHSFNLRFTNEASTRAFFNSGGQIIFSATRTGGHEPTNATNPTSNNMDWTKMLNDMGNIVLDYTRTAPSGSGSGGAGFYSGVSYGITSNSAQIFTKGGNVESGGSSYANNDYTIMASMVIGTPTYMYFDIYFRNDGKSPQTNAWGDYDYVDGTLESVVQIRRSTVGVIVPAPTATITTRVDAIT